MKKEICRGPYGSEREVSWSSPPEIRYSCPEEKMFKEIEQLLKQFKEVDLSCENDRLVLTYVLTKLIKKGVS